MSGAMLDQKPCRAVSLMCDMPPPSHTIDQRLGAFSGVASRRSIDVFKTLVLSLGLSGASPHQFWASGVCPANIRKQAGNPLNWDDGHNTLGY